jgi:signal transduction histidine kinase
MRPRAWAGSPRTLPTRERATRALERIVDDGQRASQVIGRIRALVDRQPPRKAPVDINETILHAVELAAQELRSHGIALATLLSDDLPPVLGGLGHDDVLGRSTCRSNPQVKKPMPRREMTRMEVDPEFPVYWLYIGEQDVINIGR